MNKKNKNIMPVFIAVFFFCSMPIISVKANDTEISTENEELSTENEELSTENEDEISNEEERMKRANNPVLKGITCICLLGYIITFCIREHEIDTMYKQ